jgi:hypothetical protein
MKTDNKKASFWNWGTGIVITFIIYCVFVVGAVVRSFQEDVDLVTDEYYKEELKFQQQIDRTQNAYNAKEMFIMSTEGPQIVVTFPGSGALSGEVHFYRPDNPALDKRIAIDARAMMMPKTELTAGRYKVKVTWTSGGAKYYEEQTIFI